MFVLFWRKENVKNTLGEIQGIFDTAEKAEAARLEWEEQSFTIQLHIPEGERFVAEVKFMEINNRWAGIEAMKAMTRFV